MERKPLTRRERIGKYYDELIAQDRVGFPPEKETYILVVFFMFPLFIPVQELFMGKQSWGALCCFMVVALREIEQCMRKYLIVTYERKRTEIVGEKLRYMPINRKENRRYLFGKLITLLKKITVTGLIMQLGASLIAYHSINVCNIIYVLVLTFIIPFVLCGLTIVLRDISAWR